MRADIIEAAKKAYASSGDAITLGSVLADGECDPEPIVRIPLAMLNRHGLIAGATGTGKTRTLQLVAEQLSRAGVPVFLSRSEEHTSELQSRRDLVCRLL